MGNLCNAYAAGDAQWKEMLIDAMYRTFLAREPDSCGLLDALRQLREGRSIEEVLHWFLRSEEFGASYPHFLQAHVDPRFLDSVPAPMIDGASGE